MANAGYDFIWTEMQHDSRDWEAVARMWRTCPHAKAVPGVRVAYADEREIQHAMDARRAGGCDSHGRHGGRGKSGERLDLFPAARQAQPGWRPGLRSRCVGQCSRADIATRSTTTSC